MWVAAGQTEATGMYFRRLTVVSKDLAWGKKKKNGHNKIKSKVYFHKLLSVTESFMLNICC